MGNGFDITDWSQKVHAMRLADTIRNYWASRGKRVKVEIIQARHDNTHTLRVHGPVWAVRSNMVDGLPNNDPTAPIFPGRDVAGKSPASTVPHRPQTAPTLKII